MDSDLIKQLLSNPETLKALKEAILELENKPVKKTAIKKKVPAKKTPVKKAPVKKKRVKKAAIKKVPAKRQPSKRINKNDREYGRKNFVDDLTEAIYEKIGNKKVNLIQLSKKQKKIVKPKRLPEKLQKRKCVDCDKLFETNGSYLCNSCLKGKGKD